MELYYFITTLIMFFILGLCFGSFLNVLIYRLPRGMNLSKPSSHCPNCGNPIKWYDNIPLLSYIILGGKCRHCHCHISFRYFFVELLNAILWVLCAVFFYEKGVFFCSVASLSLSVFITISFCDYENLFIPDSLQLVLLALGITSIFADPSIIWYEKLIGLAVGAGFFLFFYFFSLVVFKREGLGLGDVKLMAGVGLLLGWKATTVSIIISVFTAMLYIIIMKIVHCFKKENKEENKVSLESEEEKNIDDIRENVALTKSEDQISCEDIKENNDGEKDEEIVRNKGEFPFAPFLVFGASICLFLGDIIFNGYLSLFL